MADESKKETFALDPIPEDQLSLFEQEAQELGEFLDVYEQVVVESKPYSPPRRVRRLQAKRDRALKKRKPNG